MEEEVNEVIEVDSKVVSRKLDKEEVEAIVNEIQFQHLIEIDMLTKSKLVEDPAMVQQLREDAYFANLVKIREAKRLTREQFMEYEIDKQTCCEYNNLVIPEWEDYE